MGAAWATAPPTRSVSLLPSNATIFGSLMAVQRVGSKGMESVRRARHDIWNDLFGSALAYTYYHNVILRHPTRHTHLIGGVILLSVVHANY